MVTDTTLGELLHLEHGKFYVYHKPSFLNDFEDLSSFAQAKLGKCRSEFSIGEMKEGEVVTDKNCAQFELMNCDFESVFSLDLKQFKQNLRKPD